MSNHPYLEPNAPSFGAREASIVLFFVLLSYLLADVVITASLDFAWIESLLSIRSRSEDQIAALKRVSSGLLSPSLMFVITIGLLKAYLPRLSIRQLLGKFGLARLPPIKTLFISFVGGTVVVLVFSEILAVLFPPPDFTTIHPANVINHGSTLEKLIFVFSVVVVAPIAEEFLFRGVLYSGISHTWNKQVAAILVSACFVLIHPETISSGYWLTHVLLYVITLILILVREITGTLFTCILVHSGFNFAAVFF
jgi:uncharacterized protein